MRKKIILITMILLQISCNNTKKEDSQNSENTENISEENLNVEEVVKDAFPLININNVGFKNLDTYGSKSDGPTFTTDLVFKNNTKNKINKFLFKYIIRATFENGEVLNLPIGVNDEGLNSLYAPSWDFCTKEVWSPNSEKKMYGFTINKINGYNLSKELFKRTPETLEFIYSYEAISVDNEFRNESSFDILKYWKDYQTEIGLR